MHNKTHVHKINISYAPEQQNKYKSTNTQLRSRKRFRRKSQSLFSSRVDTCVFIPGVFVQSILENAEWQQLFWTYKNNIFFGSRFWIDKPGKKSWSEPEAWDTHSKLSWFACSKKYINMEKLWCFSDDDEMTRRENPDDAKFECSKYAYLFLEDFL